MTIMAVKKIWYVRRINPVNGIYTERHPDSPMVRKKALVLCREWEKLGWRAWVDRNDTGERIFQSNTESIEHAKLPRQVILSYKGGDFQLRVILDDGSERRVRLGLVGKMDKAYMSARTKGYNPNCFISMDSMDRCAVCYQPK
jgi:hypothetical protein